MSPHNTRHLFVCPASPTGLDSRIIREDPAAAEALGLPHGPGPPEQQQQIKVKVKVNSLAKLELKIKNSFFYCMCRYRGAKNYCLIGSPWKLKDGRHTVREIIFDTHAGNNKELFFLSHQSDATLRVLRAENHNLSTEGELGGTQYLHIGEEINR